MIVDLWVNAISSPAAEKFLGQKGFGGIEGFFGSDIRGGMTTGDLLDEMDRLGVDKAVLTSTLAKVDEETLAFVADHRQRVWLAATADSPDKPTARVWPSAPAPLKGPSIWCGSHP